MSSPCGGRARRSAAAGRVGSAPGRPPKVVAAAIRLAIVGAFVAVVLASCGERAEREPPEETREPLEGVQSFEVPDRDHAEGSISYNSPVPPVGGPHAPVWQNCGFYAEPVPDETAVHSMEHGAVWVTYRRDLPKEQVEVLRGLASGQSHVLVSPYPDLPSPVVASAWGKQLRLEGADDPRLERFVSAFRQGPQAPEAGAPCAGGVGEPER